MSVLVENQTSDLSKYCISKDRNGTGIYNFSSNFEKVVNKDIGRYFPNCSSFPF